MTVTELDTLLHHIAGGVEVFVLSTEHRICTKLSKIELVLNPDKETILLLVPSEE